MQIKPDLCYIAILHGIMGAFLFRCPNTGHNVQGWSAEEVDPSDERYEAVTCAACRAVHLVNPSTGKVAGVDTE